MKLTTLEGLNGSKRRCRKNGGVNATVSESGNSNNDIKIFVSPNGAFTSTERANSLPQVIEQPKVDTRPIIIKPIITIPPPQIIQNLKEREFVLLQNIQPNVDTKTYNELPNYNTLPNYETETETYDDLPDLRTLPQELPDSSIHTDKKRTDIPGFYAGDDLDIIPDDYKPIPGYEHRASFPNFSPIPGYEHRAEFQTFSPVPGYEHRAESPTQSQGFTKSSNSLNLKAILGWQ